MRPPRFLTALLLAALLWGCGGGGPSSVPPTVPPGLSGGYTGATFLTSPEGRLEAVLTEVRYDVTGFVTAIDEVAYLDGEAGLQSTSFLRPQGTYGLDESLGLTVAGTERSSSVVAQVASDRSSYAGDAAGAGGTGQQKAILTDTGQVAGTWTGGSLATSAFPGVVRLTLILGQDGTLDGTFDFNGTAVDITGGSYQATPDGRFQGDLVGNVQGNPVTAIYRGRANANEMVMIFQDGDTHVVALQLRR